MKRARQDAAASDSKPAAKGRASKSKGSAASKAVSGPALGSAVDVIHVSGGTPPFTSEGILQQFVHPMTPEHFLANNYRKKCLVVHGGGAERLAGMCEEYLCGLDIAKLCEETASDHVFCWMKGIDGKIGSIQVDDSASALTCYNAGASLYFRSPQPFADEFVAAMARDVKMNFGAFYLNGTRVVVWVFAALVSGLNAVTTVVLRLMMVIDGDGDN